MLCQALPSSDAFPCIIRAFPCVLLPSSGDAGEVDSLGGSDSSDSGHNELARCISSADSARMTSTAGGGLDRGSHGVAIPAMLSPGRKAQASGLSQAFKSLPLPDSSSGARLTVRVPARTDAAIAQASATAATTADTAPAARAAQQDLAAPLVVGGLPQHRANEPGALCSAHPLTGTAAAAPPAPTAASAITPAPAPQSDDAGSGSTPGTMGATWDSLPCFSPSVVDRLWAGGASLESPTSPCHLHQRYTAHQRPRKAATQHRLAPSTARPPASRPSGETARTASTGGAAPASARSCCSEPLLPDAPCAAAGAAPPNAAARPAQRRAAAQQESAEPSQGGGGGGGGGADRLPSGLIRLLAAAGGCVSTLPCMALVAAAAAGAAGPRALGAAELAAATPPRPNARLRAEAAGGGIAGAAAAAKPAAAVGPPQGPEPAADAGSKGASIALAPALPRLRVPAPCGALPPVPPASAGAVPPAAAPAAAPTTAAARAHASGRACFEDPRGHVHNGPRMPVPTSPNQQHSARRPEAAAAAAGSDSGGGGDGRGSPSGACSGPDSPLSEASTIWDHPQAHGSYVLQALQRQRWLGGGGGEGGRGGGGRSDARTQWWCHTGHFGEDENARLRMQLWPHERAPSRERCVESGRNTSRAWWQLLW